jgi:hypothetical protein
MPADPTAPNSDHHSKLCLALTASAQANGECGRAVRTSRWPSTSPPPIHVIRRHARGWPRDRTRNLAPSISLLRVIAEGAGS